MSHHSSLHILRMLTLVVISATILHSADSASNEDEPLNLLFKSFLPNAFLEKPVVGDSSVKSNDVKVKDAQSAEMLQKAERMVSGLKNIIDGLNAPDNGNCAFKCPNDVKPQPLPGFKPVPNGCGTHGLKVDMSDLPGITDCCNEHDTCYGTCNSGQMTCDKHFNSCMADACENLRKSGVITTEKRFTECMAIGATFHLTAMAVGCEFYRDSQRAACICPAADAAASEESMAKQAKIRQYNNAKRSKDEAEKSSGTDGESDLDNIDLTSPIFDLPEAVDREEL